MKTQSFLIPILASFICLTSCTKNKGTCENGVWDYDAGETEIDCGGLCDACPPAGTFTATVEGYSYVASQFYNTGSGGSGISISTEGTSGVFVGFTFVGTSLNIALPITNASTYFPGGDSYSYALTDTGSVVLTSIDTQKKIVSGRVGFSAKKNSGGGTTTVANGVFENVRYGQ